MTDAEKVLRWMGYEEDCGGKEWPNVPTIESAARKALGVLRDVEWRAKAYGDRCPDCFCAAPVHYSKCALAEAISDLEKVL